MEWHLPTTAKTGDSGSSESLITPTDVMVSVTEHCFNIRIDQAARQGLCPIEPLPGTGDLLSVFFICSGLILWLQPFIGCVSSLAASQFTLWLSRKRKTIWSCLKGATRADFLNDCSINTSLIVLSRAVTVLYCSLTQLCCPRVEAGGITQWVPAFWYVVTFILV